ncbi:hypothetical protein CBS63078_10103 [Aspergillus niger]|nr:hypothetical protein CBS133816_5548 [Aspergillus niger]KAI2887881.1 hypothetical protein CBS11852_7381 [Aspergillus niger]KAI2889949.1 hypothetical protein CBS63078_10103 [Aspergillus niger]KAI2890769.1 hypothetical protein CBS13152_5425 [Aspergillus niger]KAI2913334.1 hypothetical protein CBS147371_6965 [Aspergillus niger]
MSPFPAHSTVKAMRVTTKRVWPLYGHPTRRIPPTCLTIPTKVRFEPQNSQTFRSTTPQVLHNRRNEDSYRSPRRHNM